MRDAFGKHISKVTRKHTGETENMRPAFAK